MLVLRKHAHVFDIYTIIFLALAVFIFLRLRSVLGQRTGRERPPYDPYSRDAARPAPEKVITLPNRAPEAAAKPAEPVAAPGERWKGVAESGTPVASGLDAIAGADPEFDGKHFVTGARAAYEMIVTAFAEGDRRTLKNLLSRDVYEGFEAAITEREKAGDKAETRFVSIDSADITHAELQEPQRAGDGEVCFAACLGHPRQERQCGRGQSRSRDRRHRRVDLRARYFLARSQLEAGRNRRRAMSGWRRLAAASLFGVLLTLTAGMAGAPAADKVLRLPGAQIETLGYTALDGWAADDHAAAFGSFLKSCKPIRAGTPAMRAARPMFGALYEVCGHAVEIAAKPVMRVRRARSLKRISRRCASRRPASRAASSPAITRR